MQTCLSPKKSERDAEDESKEIKISNAPCLSLILHRLTSYLTIVLLDPSEAPVMKLLWHWDEDSVWERISVPEIVTQLRLTAVLASHRFCLVKQWVLLSQGKLLYIYIYFIGNEPIRIEKLCYTRNEDLDLHSTMDWRLHQEVNFLFFSFGQVLRLPK